MEVRLRPLKPPTSNFNIAEDGWVIKRSKVRGLKEFDQMLAGEQFFPPSPSFLSVEGFMSTPYSARFSFPIFISSFCLSV